MAAELGIGDVAFGFIFGVFALGYALGQVPSGWAADRFGPRVFLAAIVIAWSLFTGLTALVVDACRCSSRSASSSAWPRRASIRRRAARSTAGFRRTIAAAAQGLLFIGSRLGAAFGLSVVSAAMARLRLARHVLGTRRVRHRAGGCVVRRGSGTRPRRRPGVSSAELAVHPRTGTPVRRRPPTRPTGARCGTRTPSCSACSTSPRTSRSSSRSPGCCRTCSRDTRSARPRRARTPASRCTSARSATG